MGKHIKISRSAVKAKEQKIVVRSSKKVPTTSIHSKYDYLLEVEQRVKNAGSALTNKAREFLELDRSRTPASSLSETEASVFRDILLIDLKALFEENGLISLLDNELFLLKLLHYYKLHSLTELRAWWENWGTTGISTLSAR